MTLRGRNWNLPTVSRGRDTRDLVPRGHHGNRGSLTFSLPRKLGDSFLAKHGNGQDYLHVKLERRYDGNQLVLLPIKDGEFGRKMTLGNADNPLDYRVFFDASSYPWIDEIEPFGSTETTASLTDEGVMVVMPPEGKRNPLQAVEYRVRKSPMHWKRKPMPATVYPDDELTAAGRRPEPAQPQDTLYLVNVPADKDGKFHLMLKFLKLEAIKE